MPKKTKVAWTKLAPLDAVNVAIGRLSQFGWVRDDDRGVGREVTGEGDKAGWSVTMNRSGEPGSLRVDVWWTDMGASHVRVEWDGPDVGVQAYIESIAANGS